MTGLELTASLVERVQGRLARERDEPTGPALVRALRAETNSVVSDAEVLRLVRALRTELVGAGPLAELLADPRTTDVVVNGCSDVRVDRGAGWENTDLRFSDDAAVQRLARRLATAAGRRLDEAHPFVDARMADGTRLHVVLAPVATTGTALSFRVLRPAIHDLNALGAGSSFPGLTREVLDAVIQARLAVLIAGGTGSGKTTLLGALLTAVPPDERLVTVEDAEELRPTHPHVVRLIARPANVEGAGAVSLRDLVRQALRMRPDRIVLGEVRGAEVVDLLAALNTGHDGGAGTVHANTAAEVPARLEALAAMGGLPRRALHAQLIGAVQVVVHLVRSGSLRQVREIAVLRPGPEGLAETVPAVLGGRLAGDGAKLLAARLADRGVSVPWAPP